LSQFSSKIEKNMKIMPRRSATQRDAARRRLEISRRSATPRNFMMFNDFLWFFDSNLWFLIKGDSKLTFSLFFDSNLWFLIEIYSKLKFIIFWVRSMIYDKNCVKIEICIQNSFKIEWTFKFSDSNLWFFIRIVSKLRFAFRIDSKLMIQLEFVIIFDSDLWFLIRIVSKLRFASRIDSKWTQN